MRNLVHFYVADMVYNDTLEVKHVTVIACKQIPRFISHQFIQPLIVICVKVACFKCLCTCWSLNSNQNMSLTYLTYIWISSFEHS